MNNIVQYCAPIRTAILISNIGQFNLLIYAFRKHGQVSVVLFLSSSLVKLSFIDVSFTR